MVARLVGLDPTVVNFLVVEQFMCEKIEFLGLGKSGTYFYGLGAGWVTLYSVQK
jgi:hypothetical protein